MATNSIIARKVGRFYHGIYCHNSGYLEGVGATLDAHYREESQVAALIALGDLSSLWPALNPTGAHTFEKPEQGVTVAYLRDRYLAQPELHKWYQDSGDDYTARRARSLREIADEHEQWVYLFRDGIWHVNGKPLRVALANAAAQLVSDDARRKAGDLAMIRTRQELLERTHRRLVAPDLETTADWIDPRDAENPLLAFRFC